MNKYIIGITMIILLMWPSVSYAEDFPFSEPKQERPAFLQNIAVYGNLGTLGLGIGLTKSINETVNARINFNGFGYSYDKNQDNVDYDFDLALRTFAMLTDWHPTREAFRLTGGFLYNGNKFDWVGKPTGRFEIGDTSYGPTEIEKIDGTVDFNKIAVYLGLGSGNPVEKEKKFGFVFDLGIIFQGTPDVSLSAYGPLAQTSAFQSDLAQEEKDIQDDINDFKFYPVISIGVSYQF